MRQHRETQGATGCDDETIRRVTVKAVRQVHDGGGDRGVIDTICTERGCVEPLPQRQVQLEAASFDQRCHFPVTDIAEEGTLIA